ncbi:glycosyltransferase [Lactobacillus helveticus]|nr:glycosyltransferase family 4 protein [Lactobacillus helveticus]MBW8037410.1 glycosyltransferase [Lactobacillus helveticus]
MKIKRVIFICNYAANYGGNFLASLKNLAVYLKKKKINVKYIFPMGATTKEWNIELNQDQVHYMNMDKRSLRNYLKKELVKGDIVHTHFLSHRQLLGIKEAVNSKKEVKVICQEHMDLEPRHNKIFELLKRISFRIIFKKFTFIGVSSSVYQRLKAIYGSKNTYLVENAISYKRLDKKNINLFKDKKKHLIIMGTDYERKGVDIAIKAIQKENKIKSNIELDVVSNFVNDTKEKIISQFGENVLSFVNVMPTDNNVQDFYKNALAFLSPSRHEAFGYANVEAAYCGAQVIASNVPGQNTLKKIPYIIWIQPENGSSLIVAIKSVLSKSQIQLEKEAQANKEYIMKHYSLNSWTKKIYKVYLKASLL